MSQFQKKSCILSVVYDLDQNDFHHEPRRKSHLPILIGIGVFALFCVVVGVVFVPRIRRSVQDSGVIQLVLDAQSPRTETPTQARICFVLQEDGKTSFRQESVTLDSAPTVGHAVVEALLKGPPKASGLSTLIPRRTRLIGLTISRNYAFVDFSKEFSRNKDTTFLAIQQVNQTLKGVYPNLEKLVILIEGEPYSPGD